MEFLPPNTQVHEPILTRSGSAALAAEFASCYAELAAVGLPINLVIPYDDVEGPLNALNSLPSAALCPVRRCCSHAALALRRRHIGAARAHRVRTSRLRLLLLRLWCVQRRHTAG